MKMFMLVFAAIIFGFACAVIAHSQKRVVITEQDVVRYCLDRRASHASPESIKWACLEMGGDYYMAQGFTPNYDQFPSYRLFGLSSPPQPKH